LVRSDDREDGIASSRPTEHRARGRATGSAASLLRAWVPALLWATLIFLASTSALSSDNTGESFQPILRFLFPSATQGQLELMHLVVRKCAHAGEYFILYVLVYRGVSRVQGYWKHTWAVHAWVLATAYAALDETHQMFVASRTGSICDVMIDCIGVSAAVLALRAWHLRRAASNSALESR